MRSDSPQWRVALWVVAKNEGQGTYRKQPRDLIDEVEDLCGKHGSVAEVSPGNYASFIALTDEDLERLARVALAG